MKLVWTSDLKFANQTATKIMRTSNPPHQEETPMSRIMIVVEFELKPQHASDFVKLMKNHAELSRGEDGCQQFDVLQAQDDPNKILFVESWRDQAALDVHSTVPRMAENRAIYTPWLNSRKATRCNVP
jgi:quinol monooxygenase YgiN